MTRAERNARIAELALSPEGLAFARAIAASVGERTARAVVTIATVRALVLAGITTAEAVEELRSPSPCQTCGKAPAARPHTCPYEEDINGDTTSLCDCCDQCQANCLGDI